MTQAQKHIVDGGEESKAEQAFLEPNLLDEIAPETAMERPHMKGRLLNAFLCIFAFGMLIGYLFFAGEGEDLAHALSCMQWFWLALALIMVVVYWVLESVCMQIFSHDMFPKFKFKNTLICTVIGQYFNCITPLSSGGQPFQAYYYNRFGMPLSKSLPMLLCRFVTYQITTSAFCAIVLILRLSYFVDDNPALTTLVVIGFIGGLTLLAGLLAVAFWRSGILKLVSIVFNLLAKLRIVKDPAEKIANVTKTVDDCYKEMHYLFKRPKLFAKSIGVTFVQLLEYFAISYVIMRGLGCDGDFLTVISCQAFVYMISSFVPTPGAMGAAETSYALFFGTIYPGASFVALSTFIWRFLTFYFPIVTGMLVTLAVNRKSAVVAAEQEKLQG
jgi:glycosyltransferase 2 family protein